MARGAVGWLNRRRLQRARRRQARSHLALLQADYSVLLSTARAAVAADRAGYADPMVFIRDLLAERGQLPAEGLRPPELLAFCSRSSAVALARSTEGSVSGA
jgi:AraC-like DNA-binding protein